MEQKSQIILLALTYSIMFASLTECSRILCLFPSPSRSHVIIATALLQELAVKGHDVTMVSSFPLDTPMENYRDINVPMSELHQEFMKSVANSDQSRWEMFKKMPVILNNAMHTANNSLFTPEFQKIMREESFDLVIIGMFLSDFLLGVASHFNCPAIVLCTVQATAFVNNFVANPSSISTVRHAMVQGSDDTPMTFLQRVMNVLISIIEFFANFYRLSKQREFYDAIFPADKYPSFDEMVKNVSLVFVCHHFSLGSPRPYVPNMIEVSGLHINQKANPLPDDILNWFGEAPYGVVYFGLGSNFNSKDLLPEKLAAILKVFSKLEQRVLFKWEDEELPGKPDNVMIKKWVPQTDVLAHPNLKLFISHGGLGSLHESKYRGVPVLSIPLFGDHFSNTNVAVSEGWAVELAYGNLTVETFSQSIEEVLTNPKYTNRVKYLAELYQDRPTSAMETAIYWTEYVIRYRGAKHLQNQGVHLNFIQYHSFDVIAFLIFSLLLIIKLFLLLLKHVCRKICKKCKQNSVPNAINRKKNI